MRITTWAILLASHAAALGLGVALVRPATGHAQDSPSAAAKSRERSDRDERRVSTTELLEAYRHDDFAREAQVLRTGRQAPALRATSKDPAVSPEDRAALVDDIPAALDGQLDAVNRSQAYDYRFAKALIRRWLEEDPEACMKWVGGMRMQVGWGDPFNALVEALPAIKLLDLMEEGWLERNRSRALSAMAREVGANDPETLPEVLQRLEGDEAASFLAGAAREARPEDAAFWLEFGFEQQPEMVSTLGRRWISQAGPGWEWRDGELVPRSHSGPGATSFEEARAVVAAARGTPAEQEFTRLLHQAQLDNERERLLMLANHQPNAAAEQLLALEVNAGSSPAKAEERVAEIVRESFHHYAEEWRRTEWEIALQSGVLGDRPLDAVVIDRFEQVRSEVPDPFQSMLLQDSLRDAMRVDPAVAFRIANRGGLEAAAIASARQLLPGTETPDSVRAEIVLQLDQAGLWTRDPNLQNNVADFGTRYLEDDPEAAVSWRSRLSPELAREIQKSPR